MTIGCLLRNTSIFNAPQFDFSQIIINHIQSCYADNCGNQAPEKDKSKKGTSLLIERNRVLQSNISQAFI
jgi:hypothetical protein